MSDNYTLLGPTRPPKIILGFNFQSRGWKFLNLNEVPLILSRHSNVMYIEAKRGRQE